MYSARTLRALSRAQSGRSTSELESEQKIGHWQPSGFVPVGEWPTAESSSEPASFRAAGRRAPDSDGEQFAFVLRCHVARPQSATSEDQNLEGSQSPDRHVANVQLADQHAWLTPSCIRRAPPARLTDHWAARRLDDSSSGSKSSLTHWNAQPDLGGVLACVWLRVGRRLGDVVVWEMSDCERCIWEARRHETRPLLCSRFGRAAAHARRDGLA
ncbi:hypothetical protein OH76DRAFT_360936 [Lentinus brumalis]|uniref:Uncharacterized protein n=1 Tax=Lentinus brumalis TaxID=2498619 RepID=A0A371CJ56_9APHY|nr:hypothetical protein OH76DRAFT_360936 [Polyporus brumalis]